MHATKRKPVIFGLAFRHRVQVLAKMSFVYTYCPRCNLCWPDDEGTASSCDFPLYLGKLKLIPDFMSEEEEASTVASIDRIPWMPSQSGRRKQDFGPKVNFKKKKVKIGEFRGFPKFTESTFQKFKDVPELSDFQPVELCHLEYSPDRGSSIVPHVDDFWLWGERLVTVNLCSSTVLCLTPYSENTCDCLREVSHDNFQSCAPLNQEKGEKTSCRDKFQDVAPRMQSSVKSLCDVMNQNANIHSREIKDDIKNLKISCDIGEGEAIMIKTDSTDSKELQHLESNPHVKFRQSCIGSISDVSSNRCQTSESLVPKNCEVQKSHFNDCNHSYDDAESRTHFSINGLSEQLPKTAIRSCNTMCKIFRSNVSSSGVRIRIVLPPRSLLILAGCARYNWYHEIRRGDVVSRRLAMTFRELTSDFLDGGEESHVGKNLLKTASHFYDVQ